MELFVEKKMDLKSTWAGFFFFQEEGGRRDVGEKLKEKRGILGGCSCPPPREGFGGGAAACSRGTLTSNRLTEMRHLLDLTKQPAWLFKFWPSVRLS